MLRIGTMVLGLVLLVCCAAAPLACLNINKPPESQPASTDVNVGGQHGVTVQH